MWRACFGAICTVQGSARESLTISTYIVGTKLVIRMLKVDFCHMHRPNKSTAWKGRGRALPNNSNTTCYAYIYSGQRKVCELAFLRAQQLFDAGFPFLATSPTLHAPSLGADGSYLCNPRSTLVLRVGTSCRSSLALKKPQPALQEREWPQVSIG
jgi:hypothetical protein